MVANVAEQAPSCVPTKIASPKGNEPMKKLLFVNACVNRETSRSLKLARGVIEAMQAEEPFEVNEVVLEEEKIAPLTSETLNARQKLAEEGRLDDAAFARARQFRDADRIVIAAPFWASSYPASLKAYIEDIDVVGILYRYGERGPVGLCNADKLVYVTTRGGMLPDEADCGYQNIAMLARAYGIGKCECVSAAGLDVIGAKVEALLSDALEKASGK